MSNKATLKVEIDPSCSTPEIIIKTDQRTELIENIVSAFEHLVAGDYHQVTAYKGDVAVMVNQWDIIRVFTENRKVVICTETEKYESKYTLRDLEEILDSESFVRISRFEIVNLRKIHSFDLSVSGTIKIFFVNGVETWVARRHVREIALKLNAKSKGALV